MHAKNLKELCNLVLSILGAIERHEIKISLPLL